MQGRVECGHKRAGGVEAGAGLLLASMRSRLGSDVLPPWYMQLGVPGYPKHVPALETCLSQHPGWHQHDTAQLHASHTE